MGEIKRQTLNSVKWSAIERFSIQGVTFLLGLIVARLLTPADYGLVGMVGIFFGVSQTLIDSGFSNALVRKTDRTEDDFYTAFYFSFGLSILLAATLSLCSPLIADFFHQPILTNILPIMSLNLIIGTLGIIPGTKIYIALDFRIDAKINFICAVSSGILGLILAYCGYGVWALVWQGLCCTTLRMIFLWILRPSKILLRFSKKAFRQLFGYGSKLTLSSLLNTVYGEFTTIVIGKFYSPAALGYYSRGTELAIMPVRLTTNIITRVTFPILSRIQDDDERLIRVYRTYISLIMMIVVFGCLLIGSLARPWILGFLTAKWESAIIFAQIFVFAIVFDPICSLNLNLLQVKGRSDLFLRLEIIKKTIGCVILFASIPFGVIAICISKVIYTQIAVIINTYYTGKLFGLGYWQQWKDFSPYFLYSGIACIPSIALAYLCPWHIFSLLVGAVTSTILYIGILMVRKDSVFYEHIAPMLQKCINKLPERWQFSVSKPEVHD